MKCLEKSREDRYSSMEELMAALEQVHPGDSQANGINATALFQETSPQSWFEPEPVIGIAEPAANASGMGLAEPVSDEPLTPKSKNRIGFWLSLAAAIIVALGGMYALRPRSTSPSANSVSHPSASVPAATSDANPEVQPSQPIATKSEPPSEPPTHAVTRNDPTATAARARTISLLHRMLDGHGISVDCAGCSKDKPYVNVAAEDNLVKIQGMVEDDRQMELVRQVQAHLGDVKGLVVDVHRFPTATPAPTALPVVTPRQLTADEVRANEYVANAEQQMLMGNYVSAEARYQMALDLDPRSAAAKAGLEQARTARNTKQ